MCQRVSCGIAQRFEREPEDQTAVVGETVVMACRVLNKSGVLQWTKDDFGLGPKMISVLEAIATSADSNDTG